MALLTSHILRDGELVLLILKPSLWFVLFNSMRFTGVVLVMMIGGKLLELSPQASRARSSTSACSRSPGG